MAILLRKILLWTTSFTKKEASLIAEIANYYLLKTICKGASNQTPSFPKYIYHTQM